MKTLAFVYCVAGMADLLLTEAGIHMGHAEQNGVFAWLMQYSDTWVLAKAAGTVFVSFSILALRPKVSQDTRLNRVLVWASLLFLVTVQVGVSWWNAFLIGNAQ
jgi:hypothetical protein